MARLCSGALLCLLGAGCIPDPAISVPDFTPVPGPRDGGMTGTDAASPADMGAPMWQVDKVPSDKRLNGVWVDGAALAHVYAVGHEGTILHRTGGAWMAEMSGTTENLYAVVALPGGQEAYAVGADGVILHRKDGKWGS